MNDDVLYEITGEAICLQSCCQEWLFFVKKSELEKHASLAKVLQQIVPEFIWFKPVYIEQRRH